MPIPVTPEKGKLVPKKAVSLPDPCVVAGYQDCLRETLRFLVEDEHLPLDHPVVTGLVFHLTCNTAHKELEKLSQQLASSIQSYQNQGDKMKKVPSGEKDKTDLADSGLDDSDVEDENALDNQVCVYEVTFKEDTDSDESSSLEENEDSESELEELIVTAEDVLKDPHLKSELIRMVYQGCDLIASPNSQEKVN